MTMQPVQSQKRMYAVAVRDGDDLLLCFRICRSPKGDVYVEFPRDHDRGWKPHSSYHASGRHHQKSYGHKNYVVQRERPDANFSGTQCVVQMPIASDEPRKIKVLCNVADFQELFEIAVGEIRPDKYRTGISVDLTDTISQPILIPGAAIIQQSVYKDVLPWIVVTLYDTGECEWQGTTQDQADTATPAS